MSIQGQSRTTDNLQTVIDEQGYLRKDKELTKGFS